MAKHKKAQRNHKYSLHSRQRKVNRKYKDTIFRMLFKDRNNLLSLYNAMNKKNYTDASALQVVTLENAIYLGMKNDLAFIMDMNLYLYEHQSTYNPNMPLRDLFYISNEYQKMVVQQSLYSSTIQKIPAPKFIVFYNGTKEINDLTEIIYVFLTIFLYLLKCPQSLILSALRAFCFCGKPHISRSIFLYFRYQSWLKSW